MGNNRALCVADCTARGQHAPDCANDCAGCLPRLAADGVIVCTWHLDKLAADPLQLAELYDEVGLRLAGSSGTGEKTSGTRNPGLSLDGRAVEMRDLIKGTLRSWSAMIAEERGIEPPANTVHALAACVSRHAAWLGAHPAADDACNELRDLQRRAYPIAYPSGARRWQIKRDDQTVPCPRSTDEGPCPGTLWALLRQTDSILPSALQCDADEAHDVTADRWLTLGRELRRREAA